MMRLKMLCATALLVVPLSALAQSPGQSSNPAQAQFSAAMAQEIGKIDSQFLAAAEAMPEDKFNFTPESLNVPGSKLKGVRTFAMQVKHVAADNFSIWAPLTGKPEPAGINAPAGPDAMKSRTEILKFLRDSMAYSREAVTGLTAENSLQMVEFRGKKMTRLSLAVLALTHMNDHYGQIVEYLRLSGTVPPASR